MKYVTHSTVLQRYSSCGRDSIFGPLSRLLWKFSQGCHSVLIILKITIFLLSLIYKYTMEQKIYFTVICVFEINVVVYYLADGTNAKDQNSYLNDQLF